MQSNKKYTQSKYNQKNTFVFKRLEKITIKKCKKKNTISILFTLVLEYLKSSILITKDNYIFNIAKTITIEFIEINLKISNSKKAKFKLQKSNFVVNKQKVQKLFVKHITNNQK